MIGALRLLHNVTFHDRWKRRLIAYEFARYEQAPKDIMDKEIAARAGEE